MPERLLYTLKLDKLSCTKSLLHLSYHFRGMIGNCPITKNWHWSTYIQFSLMGKKIVIWNKGGKEMLFDKTKRKQYRSITQD